MQEYAFQCPMCEAELVVTPPDGPGSQIECPQCSRQITIPGRAASSKKLLFLGVALVALGVVAYRSFTQVNAPASAQAKTSDTKAPVPAPTPAQPLPAVAAKSAAEPAPRPDPVSTLRRGDTRQTVTSVMGRPDSAISRQNVEYLLYAGAEIELTDGRVTDIQRLATRSTARKSDAQSGKSPGK